MEEVYFYFLSVCVTQEVHARKQRSCHADVPIVETNPQAVLTYLITLRHVSTPHETFLKQR